MQGLRCTINGYHTLSICSYIFSEMHLVPGNMAACNLLLEACTLGHSKKISLAVEWLRV